MCEQRLNEKQEPQAQQPQGTITISPPLAASSAKKVPDAVVDAASGVVGSVVALLATFPIKTTYTLQALGGASGRSLTTLDVLRRYKLSGLYVGVEPNVVETALSSGVYFYLYRKLKDYATEHGRKDLGLAASFLVPAVAGVGNQLITMPASVIATRMQALKKARVDARLNTPASGGPAHQAGGVAVLPPVTVASVSRTILRESGPGGFWAGLLPSLVLISNPTIQYMLYEQLLRVLRAWKARRMLAQQQEREREQESAARANQAQEGANGVAVVNGATLQRSPVPPPSPAAAAAAPKLGEVKFAAWEIFLVSALSKVGATVATYWILVVKTRMQAQGKETPPELRYRGTFDALVRILRAEGLRGFSKGLGAKLVQTALNAALMLMLKEQVYTATRNVLTNPSILYKTQQALLRL